MIQYCFNYNIILNEHQIMTINLISMNIANYCH